MVLLIRPRGMTVKRRPERVSIAPPIGRLAGAIRRAPTAIRRSGVPVLTVRPGMFGVPEKRERSRFMSGRRAHSAYPRWWVILAIWTAWGLLLSAQAHVHRYLGGEQQPPGSGV